MVQISNYQKIDYLNRITQDLERLRNSFMRLSVHWSHDSDMEIDLNEYLSLNFPFPSSLDETSLEVSEWVEEATLKLNTIKEVLMADGIDKIEKGESYE